MIRLRLVTSFLVCAAAVTTSRVARAEDRPPCSDEADSVKNMKTRDASLAYPTNASAKEHLEAGKRAFGVQQYDKAIDEYTAAGLADDAPLILYNLGQTYRSAKDYPKAIRQYELFLERGKPGPEVRALVMCHITTMKGEMDHAAASAPPTGPASEPSAGQQSARTSSERREQSVSSPDENRVETRASGPWTSKRKLAVGLALGGVAVSGVGIVFAVQSQGYKDDASRLCPSDPCSNADQANALSNRAGTRATLADVSFGVGAGLVVGAVVLWFVGAPPATHGKSEDAGFIPQVTPTFSGIAYGGMF